MKRKIRVDAKGFDDKRYANSSNLDPLGQIKLQLALDEAAEKQAKLEAEQKEKEEKKAAREKAAMKGMNPAERRLAKKVTRDEKKKRAILRKMKTGEEIDIDSLAGRR